MRIGVGLFGKPKTRMIGGAIGAALLVVGGGGFAAAQQRGQAFTAAVSASQAEVFVGVTPTRVLDTRQPGQTPFAAGETRTLSFSSYVPPEATSVALALVSPANATVISYFTIWPTGTPRPETSVLNPGSPYDLAAASMQKLGTNRSVDVYNRFGQAHIVVDLMGYFVPLSSVEGIGGVLSGAAGEGGEFHIGDGPPDNSLGDDGDIYYDVINKIFFEKENGDWGDGSSAQGPAGPPGADGVDGADGADGPSAYEIAVDDGFVGTETDWLSSLEGTNGTNGAAFLSGAGAPINANGANGDTYINLSNGDTYTKAGGVWSLSGNLTGPAGPAGTATGQLVDDVVTGGSTFTLLGNTNFQTVLAYTPPTTGNYMLQASIAASYTATNPVVTVATDTTITCRWSNNPTLTFGTTLTVGLTLLTLEVPGVASGNISLPGTTAAGALVNLECQQDTLVALFGDVQIRPAVSAIEVTTIAP